MAELNTAAPVDDLVAEAANWTPVSLLEQIKENGRVWTDMAADYGPLPFDVPHRFVTSFTVESPVGVA